MGCPDGVAGEVAWQDGRFIPRHELCLPVGDAGFVLGATVTEQLRTFAGRLFLPAPHAARLAGSLKILGLSAAVDSVTMLAAAATLAAHNHRLLVGADRIDDPPSDLGVVAFVTPGDLPAQHGGRGGQPRAAIHSFPLAFTSWAAAYEHGVSLRTVSVRQVPGACWPLQAKVRSRLHYFLADREASAVEPGSRAVLAHADGRISETSTANVAVVRDGGVAAPPPADALEGVSLAFTKRLAAGLGIPWRERSLDTADLAAADEILLTSTPSCILPATRLDGRPVGDGRPGQVFRGLLAAWTAAVGIDVAAQARHHAAGVRQS